MQKQIKLLTFVALLSTQGATYGACLERVKRWCKRPPLSAESTYEEAVYAATDDGKYIDHIGALDNVGNFHIIANASLTSVSPDNPFARSFRYMEQEQLNALYAALKKKHIAICNEYTPSNENDVNRLLGTEGKRLIGLATKTRSLTMPGVKRRVLHFFYARPQRLLSLPSPRELEEKQPASKSLMPWFDNPKCVVYNDKLMKLD